MPRCHNIATYAVASDRWVNGKYEEHWDCYCWEHAPPGAVPLEGEWRRLTGGLHSKEIVTKLECGTHLKIEADTK